MYSNSNSFAGNVDYEPWIFGAVSARLRTAAGR